MDDPYLMVLAVFGMIAWYFLWDWLIFSIIGRRTGFYSTIGRVLAMTSYIFVVFGAWLITGIVDIPAGFSSFIITYCLGTLLISPIIVAGFFAAMNQTGLLARLYVNAVFATHAVALLTFIVPEIQPAIWVGITLTGITCAILITQQTKQILNLRPAA